MSYTIEYTPLDEATKPREGWVCYTDRWWVASPDGESLTFAKFKRYRSPQCNNNRGFIERMVAEMYPGHMAKFVPVVYLPPEPEDRW